MSDYSDEEFLNTLEVAGPQSLSPTARSLIKELFVRVQKLEKPSLEDKVTMLQEIARGMDGDLELLGRTPDNVNLRDRMISVMSAVRDLADALAVTSTR